MLQPLHDRFPGTRALPHVALCDLPTPLEPFALDIAVGSLAVKRDDLTSGAYGGNKARKLELLLGEALAADSRAVVTFGAYGSNHALATAVHARALGLEPHVVLSPQAPGPFAARTLRAHAGLGTVIHPVDGWDGAREAVRAQRELAARDGFEPYIIPMGGTSALGALAYVNAALEIAEQVEAGDGRMPDRVYLAAGTAGTAVGLAVGFAAAGADTRVQAVRVTPSEVCSPDILARLTTETIELLSSLDGGFPVLTGRDVALTLREEFYEPGYGMMTPETRSAVERARDAGIGLETTYTGKALAALLADCAEGRLDGADVVFLDTYSSAPLPPVGPDEALPQVLREYVAECDRLYGEADIPATESEIP